MDAETRKTLEALARQFDMMTTADWEGTDVAAAAIRAALAEVDRLTKRLDDAVEYGNEAAIDAMERHNRMNAEYAAHRDEANRLRSQVDALTQQVADLEARAIPKAWVEADHLAIEATFRSRAERVAIGQHVEGACLSVRTNAISSDRTFPTLSAALSAAKETT